MANAAVSRKLRRLVVLSGIDGAVLLGLVARAWSLGAGLASLYFIVRFLSPQLQGYYYTFNSLIALQTFGELGLTFALIQFASHEMRDLGWSNEGTLTGPGEAKRRLQSLMRYGMAWFAVVALGLVVVLIPLGLRLFDGLPAHGDGVLLPWVLLVLATAANLLASPLVAILEGCGRVVQVGQLRLLQAIASTLGIWLSLSSGGELFALACGSALSALGVAGLLWFRHRRFLLDIWRGPQTEPGIDWRHEIWPFQWRIAVSWISGYFIFNFFTPVLMKASGPVAAGQMGMSLQIVAAMNLAALTWISTKAPRYGQLVASGDRATLDRSFRTGLWQSSAFLALAALAVGAAVFHLAETSSPYAQRVLPPVLMAALLAASLANHCMSAQAIYLRAHKQDPFMLLSVASGAVTAVLLLALTPRFGLAAAVASYVACAVLVNLAVGTFIFLRCRQEWQGQAGR